MDQDDIEYDKKLADMKKYLPVLENMESRLKTARGDGIGIQLSKIQGLKSLLLSNKRMKMDNLIKCEQVLVKLRQKTQEKNTSINKEEEDKIVTEEKYKFIVQPPLPSPINMNFYKENSDPVVSKAVTADKPSATAETCASPPKDLESIRPDADPDAETAVARVSPSKDLESVRAKLKDVVAKCGPTVESDDTASKNITKLFEKEIELVTRAYIRDSNNPINILSSLEDSFIHTNKCELFIKECKSAKTSKDRDKKSYPALNRNYTRILKSPIRFPNRVKSSSGSERRRSRSFSPDLKQRDKTNQDKSRDNKIFIERDSYNKNQYQSPSRSSLNNSSFLENLDKNNRAQQDKKIDYERSIDKKNRVPKDKKMDYERSIEKKKYDKSYKDSAKDTFYDNYKNKNRNKRDSSIEKKKELSELRKKREKLVQEIQEENLFEALSDVAELQNVVIVKTKRNVDKEDGEIGESEDDEDRCIKMLYGNLPTVTKSNTSSLQKYLKYEELKNLNSSKCKAVTSNSAKAPIKVPFELSAEDSHNKLQSKTNKIKKKIQEIGDSKIDEINSSKYFSKKYNEATSDSVKIKTIDIGSESNASTNYIKTPSISAVESDITVSYASKQPKTISLIDKMADIITSEISPPKSNQEKPSTTALVTKDVPLATRCENKESACSLNDDTRLNKPTLLSPTKGRIAEIIFSDKKSNFQEDILKALADDTDTEIVTNFLNTNSSFIKGDCTDANIKILTDNTFQSSLSQKARRISLEKYKEKHFITTSVRLNEQLTDENMKKYTDIVNRVFTAKEIERFNPIIKRAVESTLASSDPVFQKELDNKLINKSETLQCQIISSNCTGPEVQDPNSTLQPKLLPPTSVECKNVVPNLNVNNVNNEWFTPSPSQDVSSLPPWVTPVHRNYDFIQQRKNAYSGPIMNMVSPNVVDLLSPKSDDRISIDMMTQASMISSRMMSPNVNINSGGSEIQEMINSLSSYDASYHQNRCDNEFTKVVNSPRPHVDFPVSANYRGKNPKPLLGYSMNAKSSSLRGSNLMSPVSNYGRDDNGIVSSSMTLNNPNIGSSPQLNASLLGNPILPGNSESLRRNDVARMFVTGQPYQENDLSFMDSMGCSSNSQFYGAGNYGMYANMGNMSNDSIPIQQNNNPIIGTRFDPRDGRLKSEFVQNIARGFSVHRDTRHQDSRAWRPSQRESSMGPSFKRDSSVGRSFGQEQNVDFSCNRDSSVQRSFRGVSVGRSLYGDTGARTPLKCGEGAAPHSVNRNLNFQRARSVGRFADNQPEDRENRRQCFQRGQSVGRSREGIVERSNYRAKSIGRLSNQDERVSKPAFQRGRSMGRSENDNIDPQRGRSTGRFAEADQSAGGRLFDGKREYFNREINSENSNSKSFPKDVDERNKHGSNIQIQYSKYHSNDRSKNVTDFDKQGSIKDPRLRHLHDNKSENPNETKSLRKNETRGHSKDDKTDGAKRSDPRRNRDSSIYEDRSNRGTNKHSDPRCSRGSTVYDDRSRRKDESKHRDSSESSTKKRHDEKSHKRSSSHKDSDESVRSKSSMLNFKIPKIKKDLNETTESIDPDLLNVGKSDIDERKTINSAPRIGKGDVDERKIINSVSSTGKCDVDKKKTTNSAPSTGKCDIDKKITANIAPSTGKCDVDERKTINSAPSTEKCDVEKKKTDSAPSTAKCDVDIMKTINSAPITEKCDADERNTIKSAPSTGKCDVDERETINSTPSTTESDCKTSEVESDISIKSDELQNSQKDENVESEPSNDRTLRDRSKLKITYKKEECLNSDFSNKRCLRDRAKFKKEPILENDLGKGRCLRDRSKLKKDSKKDSTLVEMPNRVKESVKDTEKIKPAENIETDINVESENVIKNIIQPVDTTQSEEILINELQSEHNNDGAINSGIENVPGQNEIKITEHTTQALKIETTVKDNGDSLEKQKSVDQTPSQNDSDFPQKSISKGEQVSSNLAMLPDSEIPLKSEDHVENGVTDSSKATNSSVSKCSDLKSDSDKTTAESSKVSDKKDEKGISDINSLVEILKNKDKMMEILALLNKSGEEISDKIKKKIEKLAEIESDDEEIVDLLPATSKNETALLEPETIKDQTIADVQPCELLKKPDDSVTIELDNKKINCIESPSANINTSSCIEITKPKKKYSKGNRELEMLHEYNLGMFISQDVLKATGVRSCTLHAEVPANSHIEPDKKVVRKCRADLKRIVSLKTKKQCKAKKVNKNRGQNPFVVIEKAKVDDYNLTSADSYSKEDSDVDVYEYEDESFHVQEYESYKQKPCPKSKKILHKMKSITAIEPTESNSGETLAIPQDVQSDHTPIKSSNDQQIKESKFRKCKQSIAATIPKSVYESCNIGEIINESPKTVSDTINVANDVEKNDAKTQPIVALKTEQSKSKKSVKTVFRKKKRFVWQTGIIRKKHVNKNKKKKEIKKITPLINFVDKSYHFAADVLEYECKLCMKYKGPDIVKHYKVEHPHSEVFISRLHPEQARSAVEESKHCPAPEEFKTNKFRQYRCRFCNRFFKVKQLRSVLDHILQAHTGEYKCECSLCGQSNISRCTSVCNKSCTLPPAYDSSNTVKGFICSLCNYTQISHENLKTHIALRHFQEECELIEINLTQSNARRRRSHAQECAELESRRRSRMSTRSEKSELELEDKSVDSPSRKSQPVSIRERDDPLKKTDSTSLENAAKESEPIENESRTDVSDIGVFSVSVQQPEPRCDPINLQIENDVNKISVTQIKKEFKCTDKESNDEIHLVKIKKEVSSFDEAPLATEMSDETRSSSTRDVRKDYNSGSVVCSQTPLNHSRRRVQVGALQRKESGESTEYLCFIDNCSFTSQFLLLFSRHIESQHCSDVWDGFCEMCGENVSEIGNLTGKYILALDHLIKVHVNNKEFASSTKELTEKHNRELDSPPIKIKEEKTFVPKIQLRPMTDLLAPSEPRGHGDTARPLTDLFVSNEHTAISSPMSATNEPANLSTPEPDQFSPNENRETSTSPFTDLIAIDDELANIPNDSNELLNETGLCHLRIANVVSLNPKLLENQPVVSDITGVETPSTSGLTDADQTPELPISTLISKNNSTPSETVIISRKGAVNASNLTASNVEHLDKNKRMIKYNLKNDQLFKCSGNLCRFTSLSLDDFILHIIQHGRDSGEVGSWNGCIYCDFSSVIPHELAQHILEEHGACRFECPQCSYRAAAPLLVITHSLAVHRTKLSMIGEVRTHPSAGEGALIRGLLSKRACVKSFVCTDESRTALCGGTFFTAECFISHLQTHRNKSWWCSECNNNEIRYTIGRLVVHLRTIHNFRLLTCSYCGVTFDAQTAALGHLAVAHASRRPLLYLRMSTVNKKSKSREDRVVLLNLDRIELYNNTVMTKSCQDQIMISKAHSKATPALTPFEFNVIVSAEKKANTAVNETDAATIDVLPSPAETTDAGPLGDFSYAELTLKQAAKCYSKISPSSPETLKQQATSEVTPGVALSLPPASNDSEISPISTVATLSPSVTVETANSATPTSVVPATLELIPVSPSKTIVVPIPDLIPISLATSSTIPTLPLTTDDNPTVNVMSVLKRSFQLMKPTNQIAKRPKLSVKNDTTVEPENSPPVDAINSDVINLDSDDDVPLAVTKNVIDHANKNTKTPDEQIIPSDSEKEVSKEVPEKYVEIILSDDEAAEINTNSSVTNKTADARCFTVMTEEDMIKLAKNTGLTGKNLFRCGNTSCKYSTTTSSDFKDHLRICEYAKEANKLSCFHCNRKFKHNMGLMEHVRFHGTRRYQCNICYHCSYSSQAVVNHMRKSHKTLVTQVVPVNPFKTNDDTDFYIVKSVENPMKAKGKKPGPKSKLAVSSVAQQDSKYAKKNTFGPDEIDILPMNPILTDAIHCKVCGFGTKVRSNMLRHLQMHTNEIAVPSVAPINPVPHLESNEMHFDKMTNLALSSNIDRPTLVRNVEKKEKTDVNKSAVDIQNVPKFVPEKERFVCGSHSCLYISVDEMMLRHHWEALHREETVFHCTHCGEDVSEGNRALSTAHIAAHLRLHEESLSGCESCSFMHPQARCVERHSVEAHGRSSSRNLRPSSALSVQGEMELRSWQCALCPPRTTLTTFKSEIIEHCKNVHSVRNQYKCAQCAYNSSTRTTFEGHFANKHPGRQVEVFNVYFRGDNRDENVIDNSPIWWKQRKRASMFTEDNATSQEATKIAEPSPAKKRKSSIESQESGSKNTEERILRNSQQSSLRNSQDNVLKNTQEDIQNTLPKIIVKTETAGPPPSPSKELPVICNSKGDQFVCAFCLKHYTKTSDEMKHHFYEELNYRKWACQICGYKSFTPSRVMEHSAEAHLRRVAEVQELCGDPKIETWIEDCILYQESSIEKYLSGPNNENMNNTIEMSQSVELSATKRNSSKSDDDSSSDESKLVIVEVDKITSKLASSPSRSCSPNQPLTLSQPPSPIRTNSTSQVTTPTKVVTPTVNVGKQNDKQRDPQAKAKCPHCDFESTSGIKMHIMRHWKVKPLKCAYCEYSAIRKIELRPHITKMHPGQPYEAVRNQLPAVQEIVSLDRRRSTNKSAVEPTDKPDLGPATGRPKSGPFAKSHMCLKCELSLNAEDIPEHEATHRGDAEAIILLKRSIVYKCSTCMQLTPDIPSIMVHHDREHPSTELNYVMHKLGNPKTKKMFSLKEAEKKIDKYACKYCTKKCERYADLIAHHKGTHGSLLIYIQPLAVETLDTTGEVKMAADRKTNECFIQGCDFLAHTISELTVHIRSHYIVYSCEICSSHFSKYSMYRTHKAAHVGAVCNTMKHSFTSDSRLQDRLFQIFTMFKATDPSCVGEYIDFVNNDEDDAQELISSQNSDSDCYIIPDSPINSFKMKSSPRSAGKAQVARKSTTYVGNLLVERAYHTVGDSDPLKTMAEFSFYGRKPASIDLKKITVEMSFLGSQRTFTVEKLSTIENLSPKVVVKDIHNKTPY